MTVCIAAICRVYASDGQYPMIITASDRQFSAPAYSFEPDASKVADFGRYCVGLVSGHNISDLATWIRWTSRTYDAAPTLDVEQIAHMASAKFADLRAQRAEREILSPLTLSSELLATDARIQESVSSRLQKEMQDWLLRASMLIAGIDATGNASLYTISDANGGWPQYQNALCFAAIGSGLTHARAEFMHNKYGPNEKWPPEKTLFLAYSAKRRAEVDPGVGPETDMMMIGPLNTMVTPIDRQIIGAMKTLYDKGVEAERDMRGQVYERFVKYVREFLANRRKPQDGGGTDAAAGGGNDPANT